MVDFVNNAPKEPVTIELGCDPVVNVTLTETPTGTIFVVVASADPTMPVGDFDGIFFDLAQDSTLDDLVFFPDANQGSIFSPVTGIQANANSVNTLSNGAQVKDDYDVGIQFGTVDGSTQGVVTQANFTLSSEAGPLLLEDLDLNSLTTVVNSDGGNGKVLTTNDAAGDDPVLVDTVALFEDFDDISDPAQSAAIVSDGGWDVRHGELFTNSGNEGTLTLASVDSDGPASLMFDARVGDASKFEASGRYADELRLEVRLDDGQWQTLDTFVVNDAKTALVGSETGNQITETSSTLNYEGGLLDDVDGAVQFRLVSDVTAHDEQIFIDDIKVTTSELSDGAPVAVKSEVIDEDFDGLHSLTDSADVTRADGWNADHDGALTNGHNDGVLEFARVDTDGPACLKFDAVVNDLHNFEASGHYADNLELQVRLDDGSWQTLDNFVVNHDKTALVGSESGNEITETNATLSYEGGVLDTASDSVQFRFVSDISAANEQILIDNVSVEATELVTPADGAETKIDFDSQLSSGDVVDDQFAGVTISAQRAGDSDSSENDAMIFDTNNVTGGDHDLEFDGRGNVLIISEDNDSSDADDNAGGGTITFDFDAPTDVVSVNVLDIEERGGTIDLLDDNGDIIRSINIPTTGDGGAQEIGIDTDGVSTMNVNFVGSGAIDDLCYIPASEDECDACYDVQYGEGVAMTLPMIPEDYTPPQDDVQDLDDELII